MQLQTLLRFETWTAVCVSVSRTTQSFFFDENVGGVDQVDLSKSFIEAVSIKKWNA